ncbi:hypothetical protein [Yeosuana sp.]|uniref:hypothetical protein n=1 Tax=Yeosuana sp. TaxID=2529388 RepID=UPI004054D9B4
MKLIERFGYYFGGFSIGLVLLAFFLSGKKASCDYGPNARVLKNISTKELVYSDAVQLEIANKTIDSLSIPYLLKKGDINFSDSKPREKPCHIYVIEGEYNQKEMVLTVKNCDSIATVLNISSK